MFAALPILAVITTAADLKRTVWDEPGANETFAFTGTVMSVTGSNMSYCIMDETGICYVRSTNAIHIAAGDRVKATGHVGIDRNQWQRAFLDSAEVVGRGTIPEPTRVTCEQLGDAAFDNRLVVMKGIVTDAIRDEIDPLWQFLVFRSETGPFLAAVPIDESGEVLTRLVGATVSVKGIVHALPDGGKRKFKAAQLTIASGDDITVVTPVPDDPFDVPLILNSESGIENRQYKSASFVSRMNRRRAEGRVIAVSRGRRLLLKTAAGRLFSADIKSGPLPRCGEHVAVVGFPETDLFILNLGKALCRKIPNDVNTVDSVAEEQEPIRLSPAFDMDKVLRECYGQVIGLRGTVVTAPSDNQDTSTVFGLACGNRLIPVDASACPSALNGIPSGSMVDVVGVCLINTPNWNPLDPFPRINGFTLVLREPKDVCAISTPSWWTAGRLLVVVAILVFALLAIVLWNRILHHLVERRGRQLYRTEIAKVEAELRVSERTRLAVELHDSISQTLTGVSFQIDAAQQTLPKNAMATSRFLNVARRTLLSCREELRRCLWDLRSNALELDDFTEALTMAIRPSAGDAKVSVRFAGRRAKLSDTTAHAVLNIARELTVNAVRHGHAMQVHIAGELKDGRVRFSVRDDGCGFDPSTAPGPNEGHFGLQGVRERINRLGGTLHVESKPGGGTDVTVEIGK